MAAAAFVSLAGLAAGPAEATFTKVTTGDLVTVPAWYWNGCWGDYDDDGWLEQVEPAIVVVVAPASVPVPGRDRDEVAGRDLREGRLGRTCGETGERDEGGRSHPGWEPAGTQSYSSCVGLGGDSERCRRSSRARSGCPPRSGAARVSPWRR